MSGIAVITGSSGAIGCAIAKRFKASGYLVCGIDLIDNKLLELDFFIEADLNLFVTDDIYRKNALLSITSWLRGSTIDVLVNNAAYQYVSLNHPISSKEFMYSCNVNLIAPYLLATNLINYMTINTASIVNISSIHAKLTKPGFVAYATTKAALSSLTKGLALDFGNRVRVNCVEPASVETQMLLDGFKNSPEKKNELDRHHPQGRIASPQEVAEMVFLICSDAIRFLHGSCIEMNGGIASRLHDPV
jgi:NAD(P)-dependent dehydrogenase (short-subunit alcohol dehydrogenase family)